MQAQFHTTLAEIKKHRPCRDGWEKLLKHLGKTKEDHEPLSLAVILESNGIDDALWSARAFSGNDRDFRLFAVWCARQVQHLMKDEPSIKSLDVSEMFANGFLARPYAAAPAAYAYAYDAAAPAAKAAASYDAAAAAAKAADAAAAAYATDDDAYAYAKKLQSGRLLKMINDGSWIGSTHPNVEE